MYYLLPSCGLRTADCRLLFNCRLRTVDCGLVMDIDLGKAAKRKLAKSGKKYPVSKDKGSNKKYTNLG